MRESSSWRRLPWAWWLAAGAVAAAVKNYFSVADAADLDWMLRPLSLVLQLLTGHRFRLSPDGEWFSDGAGIVLVKGCAGINFLVMSFLAWCWVARPQGRARPDPARWLEWPLLLGACMVFAWTTALLVNALRIVALLALEPAAAELMDPADAHRMIGLAVYLPALTGQLLIGERHRWHQAALIAALLYAAIMLVTPVLTGNAWADPVRFGRHALVVLCLVVPLATIGWLNYRRTRMPCRWRGVPLR